MHGCAYKALAAATIALALSGCSGKTEHPGDARKCAEVSQALLEKLLQQHAIESLPRDVRDEVAESMKANGQLCLTASMEMTSCNSGGARAPEMKRCCRFTRPPEGKLAGIPSHIRIRRGSDPQAPAVVDLEIKGALEDLALDQRCEVPVCDADRAAARPYIDVSGRVTTDRGETEIGLRLDLDARLELDCGLPDAGEGAS